MTVCRVCSAVGDHPRHSAREMMFGTGETFEYRKCTQCGCLQIAELPSDLARYYPSDYYSFEEDPDGGRVRRYLRRRRAAHILGDRSSLGALLTKRYGVPPALQWVLRAGTDRHRPILDVGCGRGALLQSLGEAGFSDLLGIDPFIEEDIARPDGVRVVKKTLADLDGRFDLIMLHHSFEHMADPLSALKHVHRLLGDEGVALLRLPLADSYAWRTYGVDWVQLDAPRHAFLHTVRSLQVLAESAGLRVEQSFYDSTAFQFWGSEQCRRGIPLMDERSYAVDPARSGFSREQISRFELRAAELNAKQEGDQAGFYLRKTRR